MLMDVQDKILSFLKSGPTTPSKVAKHVKLDTLIASAHLADLSSRKKVLISKIKVGGSPLYFLPGDEGKLLPFAQDNTNPKDYDVLQRLQKEKVLRESELDLLSKVALRHLPDFAIPLHVRTKDSVELFWKFFTTNEDESNSAIATFFRIPEVTQQKLVEETKEVEEVAQEKEEKGDKKVEEVIETKKEPIKSPLPEAKSKDEVKVEKTQIKGKVTKIPSTKEDPVPVPQKKVETKKPVSDNLKPKRKVGRKSTVAEEFLPSITNFLTSLNITINESEVIRKNKEIELRVSVESVVGNTTYFCKARHKKKCDEKDLSAAYMEAQIKKLPLLFLYSDKLTDKAQEMLKSDAFQNAVTKKIEDGS